MSESVAERPQRSKRPTRPVLRYHGGKFRLAPWVVSHFPPHEVYVEPYGGAASVLMAKDPSRIEVYNDLDSRVVDLFRVLRDPEQAERLRRAVELTPFSRLGASHDRQPKPMQLEAFRGTLAQSEDGRRHPAMPVRERECLN